MVAALGAAESLPSLPSATPPSIVVNGQGLSAQSNLAVFVCQGLYSRWAKPVYVVGGGTDTWWLQATGGGPTTSNVSATTFLHRCLVDFPRAVRYNYTAQQELLPSIITMASVLDGVPLEGDESWGATPIVFDATKTFSGFSELDSTAYVFDHYGNRTTGVAKLNPGWKWDGKIKDQLSPTLTGTRNEISSFPLLAMT